MSQSRTTAEPLLRRGDRGEDVERLQSLLADVVTPEPVVDGIFGEGTESAVRAFQDLVGLRVDGRAGEVTWGALLDEHRLRHPVEFEGDTIEVDAPAPPTFEDSERGGRLVADLMDDAAEEFRRFAEVHNEWVNHDSSAEGRDAFLKSAVAILKAKGSPKGFAQAGGIFTWSFLKDWVAANQAGEIAALESEYFRAMSLGFLTGLQGDPPPEPVSNEVLAAVQRGAYDTTEALSPQQRRDVIAYLLRKGDASFVLRPGQAVSRDGWAAALRGRGFRSQGLRVAFDQARDRTGLL